MRKATTTGSVSVLQLTASAPHRSEMKCHSFFSNTDLQSLFVSLANPKKLVKYLRLILKLQRRRAGVNRPGRGNLLILPVGQDKANLPAPMPLTSLRGKDSLPWLGAVCHCMDELAEIVGGVRVSSTVLYGPRYLASMRYLALTFWTLLVLLVRAPDVVYAQNSPVFVPSCAIGEPYAARLLSNESTHPHPESLSVVLEVRFESLDVDPLAYLCKHLVRR